MATFADYLATGSGNVAFRLVIEGCKYEFVTDPAMEGAIGDGRYRVRGLERDGISIEESAYMAGAELNLKLSTIQITETSGPYLDAATQAFTGYTATSTLSYLANNFTVGDGSATVESAAALSAGQVIHIGTAAWRIDSTSPSGSIAPDTIFITEGMWRTTPQNFATSTATATDPSVPMLVALTSAPANYAGRRVWLYGHGTSELGIVSDDDGTLLWRGILATNPELTDATTWSLSMQSRLSLFDAEIGKAASGGTKLRGVYYPAAAPIFIRFQLRSGPNQSDGVSVHTSFYYYGFTESNAAFCVSFQAAIAADPTISGWGGTWTVRETDVGAFGPHSGGWDLFYTPNAATPKWIDVLGGSGIDGGFVGGFINEAAGSGAVATVIGGTEYRCDWRPSASHGSGTVSVPIAQLRQAPRANYTPGAGAAPAAALATWPIRRFYLDFAAALASWGTVKITPPTPEGSTTAPAAIDAQVGVFSTAGYIEITDPAIDLPWFAAAGTYGPTFELTTLYGPITSPTGCTFAQFMQAIVDAAPATANLGAPFILSDDVADWTDEVAAVISISSTLARRVYSFAKPIKLIDVVREECKLHGLYLCLDGDGKIAVRRLPAADSTTPSLVLDATIYAPDDDFGKEKLAPDGIVSSVVVKSGYVSADDKWLNSWTFDALGTASTTKGKGQKLEIAPYAKPFAVSDSDGGDVPYTTASVLVGKVLTLFGQQYYYVDLPVTMLAHGKRIGDTVLVTVKQLPYGGARGQNTSGAGMTNVRAWVVGRSWPYGSSPVGVFTLLMQARNTAGYAPTLRIATASGAGASWTFHCEDDFYGPKRFDTGQPADASFFAAGYKVVVWEFDSDTPASYTGTVSSVVGDDIAITFDATFPGLLGRTMDIAFGTSNSGISLGQKAYAYMADPTGRITYNDGTGDIAREFS